MDDGERIGLTLWDSESLDKNIIDLQLREMSSFLESKFEDTLSEEMKVIRSPGVRDTHIHCVFLVLDPLRLDTNIAAAQKAASSSTNGAFANGKSHPQSSTSPKVFSGLDEDLDLQVLRTLQGKTTVVPVISKADTITTAHMGNLKRAVWDSLKKANLDPLEALGLDDGDDDDVADSDAESPVVGRKHDSKRLDERDEDALLRTDGTGSPTSHLDSASESSDSDAAPARKPPTHSRASSSTFPPPPANTTGGNSTTAAADSIPYLPLSIISPEPGYSTDGPVGRQFPWGFADPYNVEHCDFVRLKEAVFREWRGELREASRELWYEGWRTSRLNGSQGRGRGVGRAR